MSGTRSRDPSAPDIAERGRSSDGTEIRSDRRLFVQFHAFTECGDSREAVEAVRASGVEAAVYENLSDPRGIGLVTFSDNAVHFVTAVRELLAKDPFSAYSPQPEHTLFGRTYSIGYEPDLEEILLRRPRRRILNPEWPWAVWYPLRRSGAFEQLEPERQQKILGEHAAIGIAFGEADLAHDVRLACHGMDKNDNDFVVGLLGADFYPLSVVVQRMRGTSQTSTYLERLGPFFAGHVVYQSPLSEGSRQ